MTHQVEFDLKDRRAARKKETIPQLLLSIREWGRPYSFLRVVAQRLASVERREYKIAIENGKKETDNRFSVRQKTIQ